MDIRTLVTKEHWDEFVEQLERRTSAEWYDVGGLKNRNPFEQGYYNPKHRAFIATSTDAQDCGLRFIEYIDAPFIELSNEEFINECEAIFPKFKDGYLEKSCHLLLEEKWMEDLLENLRNGYAIVLLPDFSLLSTFGFSMDQSENIECDLEKIRDSDFFVAFKTEWQEDVGEGNRYIVVKPCYNGKCWEFEFDDYCNKKNYITKLIN